MVLKLAKVFTRKKLTLYVREKMSPQKRKRTLKKLDNNNNNNNNKAFI